MSRAPLTDGHYWLHHRDGTWTIGRRLQGRWTLFGYQYQFHTSDMEADYEIGPRVEEPR